MNIVLVHGSLGKPFENWFPWLERELSRRDIPCLIPSFPTPEHQTYDDWEKLLEYYRDRGLINRDTVLVGHSCGAICIARYIATHQLQIKGMLCVSGYNNFISGNEYMDKLNKPFYVDDAYLDVKDYVKHVVAFYSDDDPHIPFNYLAGFAKTIGAEERCVQNAGHFNTSSGYTACDEVLTEILSLD